MPLDATSAALRARFWKEHLLSPEVPRAGDKAIVMRNHGCGPAAQESGLLVRVVNAPTLAYIDCEHCGGRLDAMVSEVELIDELGRKRNEGVYGYPINWLQRVLPLKHEDASQKQVVVTVG